MEDSNRVITPRPDDEDQAFELSLRPRRMAEFIGQAKIKRNLEVFIRAALNRGEPLDHVLLSGPPGLGKTTLAHVIAIEMGTQVRVTSGPALERAGDLAAILSNLSVGEVLFVDEIHRLPHTVEEVLYPALEDFALDLVVGQGPSARTVRLDIPRFTLVGATTRTSLLSGPLRSRFGIVHRLDFYTDAELETIITRSAHLVATRLEPEGARELARRSRGTPRIANRLLRRVRDFAQVEGDGCITAAVAARALDLLEVDEMGLDDLDRRILVAIIEKFDGGPVGLSTLSAALAEERAAIEEIYEPFLIQRGLLQRTPRGRVASALAYRHLGLKPASGPPRLFG